MGKLCLPSHGNKTIHILHSNIFDRFLLAIKKQNINLHILFEGLFTVKILNQYINSFLQNLSNIIKRYNISTETKTNKDSS